MSFDLGFIYIIIQVIFLEGILSIDNAAVLGAMVSVLSEKEEIPWPGPLKFLTAPLHRLLGGQRSAALKVGLLGAYIGRGLMLVLASFIIRHGFLKLLGAAYLIKLAFDNLAEPGENDADFSQHQTRHADKGFWSMVIAVELADLAFSLDNVVAVVALSNNLYIVMFGVAIGILTMRFAARIFTFLIEKEPVLKSAAYVVVFNIGLQLLLDEFLGWKISGELKFAMSAGILIFAVAYARVKCLHFLRPIFSCLYEGMVYANEFLDWVFSPLKMVLKAGFRGIAFAVRFVLSCFRKK